MKEKDLRPEALAILARCHIMKGRVHIHELSSWSGFSVKEVEEVIRFELQGLCYIDGNDAVGKIGKEKPVKSSHRIPCPHDKIVDLWNTLTAGVLPKVLIWEQGSERYRNLAARWSTLMETIEKTGRTPTETMGLATIESMIRYMLSTQFLTGQCKSSDGRPPFKATLEFLARAERFQDVANRKYK